MEWHVAQEPWPWLWLSDLRETHQMRNTRIKHENSACQPPSPCQAASYTQEK